MSGKCDSSKTLRVPFATNPPLRARECADWMGCSTGLIYNAITRGVWAQRTTVKLQAQKLTGNARNARPSYRIHGDDFIEFLRAIGWPRIPTRSG